jgi:hypothetical protein
MFEPSWPWTIFLAASPTALCLGLWFVSTAALVYGSLCLGLIGYLLVAFRDAKMKHARRVALWLLVPPLLLLGLWSGFPGQLRFALSADIRVYVLDVVLALYFLVLTILLIIHVVWAIEHGEKGKAAAWSTAMLVSGFWAYLYEGGSFIYGKIGGDLLSHPFYYPLQEFVPFVMMARMLLWIAAGLTILIVAFHQMKPNLPDGVSPWNVFRRLGVLLNAWGKVWGQPNYERIFPGKWVTLLGSERR